ncbi:hypothetical protein NDU88_005010 [Pleurodeles waltl]|uniref:Uncharacterized protein n=1 Tax=Pleurodeles waltl TaxID=8319 RepID=A0AAV7RMK3_PLEWA|nr:hypothetical protein NDU88_005010 [Pleurodeles waltl]
MGAKRTNVPDPQAYLQIEKSEPVTTPVVAMDQQPKGKFDTILLAIKDARIAMVQKINTVMVEINLLKADQCELTK